MSVFNVVVILPRLLPGVPTGVDTASHLYKVMLSYKSYLHSDGIPFWTPDWYAGTPIGILYSPLSYLLALPVAFISSDPILAYKLVESAFYVVTPLTIYFLARELELSRLEATMALLLFSLTPAVIENHVFYDKHIACTSNSDASFVGCLHSSYNHSVGIQSVSIKGGSE